MASSTSERIGKEEVPSKFCGAAKYKIAVNKEWFNDENYKGIFNHSKIDSFYSVDYIICVTDVYVAHQSIRDLKRHCESSIHKKNFHLYGCNLPLIISILRKIQNQKSLLS